MKPITYISSGDILRRLARDQHSNYIYDDLFGYYELRTKGAQYWRDGADWPSTENLSVRLPARSVQALIKRGQLVRTAVNRWQISHLGFEALEQADRAVEKSRRSLSEEGVVCE